MNKKHTKTEFALEIIERLEKMHPEARCALNYDTIFHLVIAVSLSAQTTDVSVNKVTPVLFEKYPEPKDLANANVNEVEEIIHHIGMYHNKAKNIVALSKMLVEQYNSIVPDKMDELVKLPGVGRKTANVVLSEGFGRQAIAVDTHVFRVANRIGLADAKDVAETEEQLLSIIPENKWSRAHHLLIFHGRKCCIARKPKCDECLLSELCVYNANK